MTCKFAILVLRLSKGYFQGGGLNFTQEKIILTLWWQGYSGLRFMELKKLLHLKKFERKPDFLCKTL